MSTLFYSEVRGRTGRFTVSICDSGGADGGGTRMLLAAPPVLRYGRLDIGYGIEVLPSFAQLAWVDPRGAIRDTFPETFDEQSYLLVISGEHRDGMDGRLREFLWKGRVRKAGRRRPIARRVHKGVAELDCYDALGNLKDTLAASSIDRPVGYVIGEALLSALPLRIYWFSDPWPSFPLIYQKSLRFVRYTTEIAGGRLGDYGSMKDQLEKSGVYFGLRIYQSTSDATWRVQHRATIGEGTSDAEVTTGTGITTATWSLGSIESDALSITESMIKGEDEDSVDTVSAAGAIKLTGDAPVNLITDGCFAFFDANGPIYWSNSFPAPTQVTNFFYGDCETGVELGNGHHVEQELLGVSPEPGVRLRVRFWENGSAGHIFDLTLALLSTTGTVYYYNISTGGWTTTLTENAINRSVSVRHEIITQSDFPAAGRLFLQFESVQAGAQLSGVDGYFVDELGNLIEDWTVKVAGAEAGITVELERAPALEVDTDGAGTWQPTQDWTSRRYGGSYNALGTWQATDRLAQQSQDLDALDTTIRGLHGPQRRILYDLDEDGADEHFLPVGLELRLILAETRGVWCLLPEAIESPLALIEGGSWQFQLTENSAQILTLI